MLPWGEYLDRRPIPQVSGEDGEEKRNDPEEEAEKNKNLSNLN